MSERDSNPGLAALARDRRLLAALALSLFLHGVMIGAGDLLGRLTSQPQPTPPATLEATLPPLPRAAAPMLRAPESVEEAVAAPASPPPPPPPPAKPRRSGAGMQADLAAQASRQIARHLLYPEEAIARGLEGEALVMLFLDADGNAVAARLERTSGHAILDDAAVAAARQVSALPEGEPREVLLPVRFRLR